MIKICNVAAQATGGLAPPVLQLIAKEHVARPEFSVTEGGELSSIRPEHQCDDNTLKVTSQFWRRLLEVFVSLYEGARCIELSMNVDWGWGSHALPKEVIWLIVEQFVMSWVRKFFADDGDERVVIHVAHMVVVYSWFGSPFMKWNFDGDHGLGPASTLKGLIWPCFFHPKLCIDEVPASAIDIFWLKFMGADNLYEILEAFFRLLNSAIPVPVPEEKGQSVWIWIEK